MPLGSLIGCVPLPSFLKQSAAICPAPVSASRIFNLDSVCLFPPQLSLRMGPGNKASKSYAILQGTYLTVQAENLLSIPASVYPTASVPLYEQ